MSEIAVGELSMPSEDQPSSLEITEEQYKLNAYYEWENGCEVERIRIQDNYGSCSVEKYYGPEKPLWENEKFDDDESRQVWTGAQIIEMNKKKRTFSQAAILLASSHEHARFFDDIMCDYVGDPDPKRLGQFREISPERNHTPFEVQHDYNIGKLNAFTGNTIIHVRETLDPEATTRSQKLFIVAIDLMTMDVQRLYADDKPRVESLGNPEMHFNDIIPLTSQTLQGMNTYLQIADDNPLKPYVYELFENQAAELQPQLVKSANHGWRYKPEGHAEYSKLHPIERLDQERRLLWALGPSVGYAVTDRGAILQPFSLPEITQ